MAFNPEIKQFAKNTIIFTLIFSIIIHFSWEYIVTMLGFSARAYNEQNFENANIIYIGNTATALSLRLGGMWENRQNATNFISDGEIISITEVMNNPSIWQEKLIASNMLAINTYANVLKTDILQLLDNSGNRSSVLDNHISLLKSYYHKTESRLQIVREQKNELKALMQKSSSDQSEAKAVLQKSYKDLEYSGVDNAISQFLYAKNTDSRAKIYMIYLERFEKSYMTLQNKNKKILDAIINNRDGIIKKSVVIIPDTGTDIIKELWLIRSEADHKAQKALE